MTTIDRRRFVTAIGAATAVPAMTATAASLPPASSSRHKRQTTYLSFLARQVRPDLPDSGVDFWSRPWGEIAHADYLPPNIARGIIWHDRCPANEVTAAIEAAAAPMGFTEPEMPRRFAVCGDLRSLPTELASVIDAESDSATLRTAFIALDSFGPLDEPPWADLLPVFRSRYDRIIGHFHLERRGLRQWKEEHNSGLRKIAFPGKSYFEAFFLDAAAQCDAVILTSPALVEYDIGFGYQRASAEQLVGQQIRRLGHALLDRTVVDRIVGVGERGPARKPRLFALGSNAFHSPGGVQPTGRLMLFDYSLGQQQYLVQAAFGEPIWSEPPLLVITYDDHRPDQEIMNSFVKAYRLAGPTYDLPRSHPESGRPDSPPSVLELIAL
jgi:hypothetical protein